MAAELVELLARVPGFPRQLPEPGVAKTTNQW